MVYNHKDHQAGPLMPWADAEFTESSSSLRIRAKRTRTRKGTFLTPWLQRCLLSLVSTLTSLVPICFSANFLISLIARGARYLNPMPCNLLWRLIVYSRVTTSPMVDPLFSLGILKAF